MKVTSLRTALTTLSTAALSATLGLSAATPAEAVTFRLDWTGQTLGYRASGRFSYDEAATPEDGVIRAQNLDSFDIAFFTPNQQLIAAFPDNHLTTDGFNFNFDSATGEILQTGRYDTPTGISVGGEREKALNFFSAPNPKAALFATDAPSPHVHLTDWANEYPDLSVGFTRGARPHLDIAFFTRTRAEVLADSTAGSELGQKLTATAVPEPSTWLGLGAASVLMIAACRRQSQDKA